MGTNSAQHIDALVGARHPDTIFFLVFRRNRADLKLVRGSNLEFQGWLKENPGKEKTKEAQRQARQREMHDPIGQLVQHCSARHSLNDQAFG